MPRIYLSPSTQESNLYVTGSGSEEQNMNLLADALEPYLYSNGIQFVRNTPQMTAASSIAQANAMGGFDFYLALHSNAAGADGAAAAGAGAAGAAGAAAGAGAGITAWEITGVAIRWEPRFRQRVMSSDSILNSVRSFSDISLTMVLISSIFIMQPS